jgi:TOTE conflict system primase-like protein
MRRFAACSLKTGLGYRSSRGVARHLHRSRTCRTSASMSTQPKTQRSPCFVACSEDGRTSMPFECDSKAERGVMSRPRFATGRQSFLPRRRFERRSIKRPRKLLPLTDDVLRQHLEGKQTIGVYPLLLDETCWFLAVDFDKKSWQDDASAFLETCRNLGVSAALERSRSGNGAHAWIFFEHAIPASTARKLGSLILTKTMDRRHQLGMGLL